MKTENVNRLIEALGTIAPQIEIGVLWSADTCADFRIFDKGNALENEKREDWQPWETEVRATAILNGKRVTGSAYLCGTWEKFGDNPKETNPDVSGYLKSMIGDALAELMEQLNPEKYSHSPLLATAHLAREFVKG